MIKVILVFVAIILFVFNYMFLLVGGFERSFLNYEFYEELVAEKDVGDELVGLMTDDLIEGFGQQQQQQEIDSRVSEEGLEERQRSIIEESFDGEWIEGVFLDTINTTLLWIKGSEDDLDLVIDISDRKEILIENIIEEMEEDMGEMPDELKDDMLEETQIAKSIPEEISLGQIFDEEELRSYLDTAQTIYTMYLFVPPVIFILFIALFGLLSGWAPGLKWFSITIFISSVFSALSFISISFLLPGIPLLESLFSVFIGKALTLPIIFILASTAVFIAVKIYERKASYSQSSNG